MKIVAILAALVAAAIPLGLGKAIAAPPASASEPANARFSVAVEGKGHDVIMIPGLTSSRHVWDAAVAGLHGSYRVHRVQIAGFAGEPAGANGEGEVLAPVVEALDAYIKRNRLDHPRIVGHSMGGLLALMLAERHPDDVGAVLVVDALPFYPLLFGPAVTVDMVRPQAEAAKQQVLNSSDTDFRALAASSAAQLVRNEAARPQVIGWSSGSDRKVAGEAMYEVLTSDVRPGLATLKAPVTVIYAVNQAAPAEKVEPIFRGAYAGVPNVKLVPITDSYHFVMLDQPERFQTVLADFLKQ